MRRYSVLALAITSVAMLVGEAAASGFYNMPTSLQQCLGMGFGPGYHAPMLLGRSWQAKIASQPLQRLPRPLSPPNASCRFCEPTHLPWTVGESAPVKPAYFEPTPTFAGPQPAYETVPVPVPAR